MQQYDVTGIGIGPFNLSLAALLAKVENTRARFFDQRSQFIWHPGMLMSDATIQVSHLYDLVTLVDPTSPYSFLSFLASRRRLYRFANSNFPRVMRKEFSDYFAWVSRQLPSLNFDEKVLSVEHQNKSFVIHTSRQSIQSSHLVLGTGLTPYVPAFAKPCLGKKVFHCSEFLLRENDWRGKRVMIVGGGQSGAEIFMQLIRDDDKLPRELTWISRRDSFLPMDESPFTDEIYTPAHTESFYQQNAVQKQQMLQEQLLSSDGISIELLQKIYQRLYVLECLEDDRNRVRLLPRHALTAMSAGGTQLQIQNTHTNQHATVHADIVIFCTGYQWQLPAFLEPLRHRIELDAHGKFSVNEDFSIVWDGAGSNRIYVQNAARHTHGVPDPNLSLAAWRSAKIINSVTGRRVYHMDQEDTAVDWDFILTHQHEGLKHASNS